MAAGVVDELELVHVHIEQRALAPHGAGLGQQGFEPVLELAPVHEAGQRIVAGLPRQLLHIVLLARHVVQHQHGAGQRIAVADGRAHQLDRHDGLVRAHQGGVHIAQGRAAAAQDVLHQRVGRQGRCLAIEHQQLRQRLAGGLGGRAGQQGLGGGVHVEHLALGVGGHHTVANGGQGGAGLLAFGLQGLLGAAALLQQALGVPQGQHDQHGRHAHVGPHQQQHDLARAFAQGLAEVARGGGHSGVDLVDGVLPPLPGGGVRRAVGVALVDLVRQLAQRVDVFVADEPVAHGFFDQVQVVEVAQQPDQAVDVVRVVAAAQKALARHIGLHLAGLQSQPRRPVAQGDVHGAHKPVKRLGRAVDRVLVEVVDGVLLPLGPQAFARHKGAHARQNLQAGRGTGGQQQHHHDEGPCHPQGQRHRFSLDWLLWLLQHIHGLAPRLMLRCRALAVASVP